MGTFNLRKVLLVCGTLLSVLVLALGVVVTPTTAASSLESDCTNLYGTFSGSGATALCSNATYSSVLSLCPPGAISFNLSTVFTTAWVYDVSTITCNFDAVDSLPYGMQRKGYCKLVSIAEEGFLGGTISATVKGTPKHLKLKADGKTYILLVVPGSIVANGDGTATAQFYTLDPETGQALVPAGEYSARCHGSNGSKDGGSSNTVSISY